MPRANQDLRERVKKAGLFLWQVADRYGVNDSNFSRMLRKELPDDKKQQLFNIISQLERENREAV